jgi:protein TonB
MFEFDIGSTRMSLDRVTLRRLPVSEGLAESSATSLAHLSAFRPDGARIDGFRTPEIAPEGWLRSETLQIAPTVDLGSSRRQSAHWMREPLAALSGGFDLMNVRPGIGRGMDNPGVELGAAIWAAAIVFSLLLHCAGFFVALSWPAPAMTAPEAIPVEIILEPPPAMTSPDSTPQPPSPIANAPSQAAPAVPAVATPEPLPSSSAQHALDPRVESPAGDTPPSPIPASPIAEAAPAAPPLETPPILRPDPAPLTAEPPPVARAESVPQAPATRPAVSPDAAPSTIEPSPDLHAASPQAPPPDARPSAVAPPSVETPAVAESAPPPVTQAPEPPVFNPPIATPEPAPILADPPAPAAPPAASAATSGVAARAEAQHSPIAAPTPAMAPIRQAAKPRADASHKPIARPRIDPATPKSAPPTPAFAKAASSAAAGADVADYQRAVAARISAMKRYPEAARERAPHGVAVVRFSIGASGQIGGVSIAQSAGDAILDAEALATVRRASPFPPPPQGAPPAFLAPLSFRIR